MCENKFVRKVLPLKFFNRPTLAIARDLLGKFLVCKTHDEKFAVMITEVEAYDGPHDKASHAHRGRTKRNEIMFGEAGRWYVYLIYGMYSMLNIVTGPKDYPAAVLIRGGIVTEGGKWKVKDGKIILNGPGKLTQFLKIDNTLGERRAEKKSGCWIENRGVKIKKSDIKKSPRIGVEYAKEWAEKPYRFYIDH